MAEESQQLRKERRGLSAVFFLIYFVQKLANNIEGITRVPIVAHLLAPVNKGGLAMPGKDLGTFMKDSAIGWSIKAFLGVITDNLPLLGYRRKSWLIVSSLIAGCAWLWLALTGASTVETMFVGILIVNLFIAYSDVVCDGAMVEAGQKMEATHGLPKGEGNRPLQAAQWMGAMMAIVISSVAGGIIAQYFNFRIAAAISGVLPVALALIIAFVVKEEKVALERGKALKGIVGIALVVVVAWAVLGIKHAPKDTFIGEWAWLLSNLVVIVPLLMFVRPPASLVFPCVLIFLWKLVPHMGVGAGNYVTMYFTEDSMAFAEALKSDTSVVPMLKEFVIRIGMASPEEIDKSGLATMFYGSVGETVGNVSGLIALGVFIKFFKQASTARVFSGGALMVMIINWMYMSMSEGGYMHPLYFLVCAAASGAVTIVVLMAVLMFAAERTPTTNQASCFALLMGLANLGQLIGLEQWGMSLYTSGKMVAGGAQDPERGMLHVQNFAFVYAVGLLAFILLCAAKGLFDTEKKPQEQG